MKNISINLLKINLIVLILSNLLIKSHIHISQLKVIFKKKIRKNTFKKI